MKKKNPPLTPDRVKPSVQMANYHDVRPGMAWGPRTIPDFELVFMARGTYLYEAEGETPLTFREGDVLCIYPGVRHVLRNVGDVLGQAAIGVIHFELAESGSWLKGDYRLDPSPPVHTRVAGDYEIHELFRRNKKASDSYGLYRQAILSRAAAELWLRLAEYWAGAGPKRLSPKLSAMIALIRRRLPAAAGRQELAREFGVTPEHVNAMFKSELGVTPGRFARRERARLACQYLREEGLSVSETAARLGFRDPFHFSKTFKKEMGLPPSAYAGHHESA